MTLYRFAQALVKGLWPLVGRLDVRGLENIRKRGRSSVANHQSILIPSSSRRICPRAVHTMAKSTQFASPVFAGSCRGCSRFPVRRLKSMRKRSGTPSESSRKEPVGIYVEGEELGRPAAAATPRRCAPRPEGRRPVVPVTIVGAYEAWRAGTAR